MLNKDYTRQGFHVRSICVTFSQNPSSWTENDSWLKCVCVRWGWRGFVAGSLGCCYPKIHCPCWIPIIWCNSDNSYQYGGSLLPCFYSLVFDFRELQLPRAILVLTRRYRLIFLGYQFPSLSHCPVFTSMSKSPQWSKHFIWVKPFLIWVQVPVAVTK